MMKSTIVCCLLFVVSGFLLAQHNREEKLQQLKSRTDIKVTEIEKDIIKIEYPNGKVMYKNIGEHKYPASGIQHLEYSPTYDSTIIDLTTIDTLPYYQKYSFLQEISVGSYETAPPLVADINNNSLAEIYGIMKNYSTGYSNNTVMEMNEQGDFDSVYQYDSTSVSRTIYDVNKDGKNEILLHRFPPDTNYSGHSWLFFSQRSDTSLATVLSFVFDVNTQQNKNTFGNWDNDEFTDQIFGWECCPNGIAIYEYNHLANNFDSVYYYDPSQFDLFWSGFAIGDINQNGKTEFFAGSVNGKVIAIENCGDNCYNFIWQGSVETNNAYLYAVTNDLDGNGKSEVWIGGYHFWNGEAITRITIFEASINNNYVAVGKIDIIGAFNFYAKNMQVLDVDKDGKQEVMMCIEQHVIILKFNGGQNHHTYEVFYIKRNDLAFSGRNSVFYGATMYDVTNDGKEDIVIHLDDIITNVGMRLFTFIYKADFSVDVNEPEPLPEEFRIYQNYPNPFNPETNIRFALPNTSVVSIKVYDILGKEIKQIINETRQSGGYELTWNGTDNSGNKVPSGVYFITMFAVPESSGEANSFQKTIKAVLIK